MSEFDIISRYFARQTVRRKEVVLGIGDDAALVRGPADASLAIAMDTLNIGVHFPGQTPPYSIGWKALAVNLSDLAAMGAEPVWFTLSLSMPEADDNWLHEFSTGLFALANRYDLQLIGGDTTRGPLSVTVQIAGNYPSHFRMLRASARCGDRIYVTGKLGDAALGLLSLQQSLPLSHDEKRGLLQKLERPQPRVREALALRPWVNAAIDISDGLAADLGHILQASKVGAEVQVNALPVSRAYRWCNQGEQMYDLALCGGDDYELCMTVAPDKEAEFLREAEKLSCQVSHIGEIVPGDSLQCFRGNQQIYQPQKHAYDHFIHE